MIFINKEFDFYFLFEIRFYGLFCCTDRFIFGIFPSTTSRNYWAQAIYNHLFSAAYIILVVK